RLGLTETASISVTADGAKWIWNQVAGHLPGATGVLDIYHAVEHLWTAARAHFGEGAAESARGVEQWRGVLVRGGAGALVRDLVGDPWSGVRGDFEAHLAETDYAGR